MKQTFISFFACLALFITLPQAAFAVSEKDYDNQMKQLVWPFYQTGEDGSFAGVAGKTIRYRKWENPSETGAIVILPGRSDAVMNYAETIYDLAQKGYSIYAIDHRGQGASDRILANPELGYVQHFEDYVTDAKIFVDRVVNNKAHGKLFLLAHSMGGAIAAMYLEKYPDDFSAAALVAPMLQINTSPYSQWEARVLAWWNVFTGKGAQYAPTQKDFDPHEAFTGNDITSSWLRFENHKQVLVDHPNLQLGGATNRWIKESMKAGLKIHDFAPQIETPIVMLTAGADTIVGIDEQGYFCTHAKRCTQVPAYATSKHDILNEVDAVRDDALKQILEFYSEQ